MKEETKHVGHLRRAHMKNAREQQRKEQAVAEKAAVKSETPALRGANGVSMMENRRRPRPKGPLTCVRVGQRVRCSGTSDGRHCWFAGTVVESCGNSSSFCVAFDDGDQAWMMAGYLKPLATEEAGAHAVETATTLCDGDARSELRSCSSSAQAQLDSESKVQRGAARQAKLEMKEKEEVGLQCLVKKTFGKGAFARTNRRKRSAAMREYARMRRGMEPKASASKELWQERKRKSKASKKNHSWHGTQATSGGLKVVLRSSAARPHRGRLL